MYGTYSYVGSSLVESVSESESIQNKPLFAFVCCFTSNISTSSTIMGSSGGGPCVGSDCCGSCLTRSRRLVIGNALLYLSITLLYNLKGFPELMVFLLLDANDSMVFNAVLIFLIFLSSYSLITSLILALFESKAFLRYDLKPMILVLNTKSENFISIYLY